MSSDVCGDVHLYKFSHPIYCVHHPRAAKKMWANTFVMISPTHTNAIVLFLNTAWCIHIMGNKPIDPMYIHAHVCIQCLYLLVNMLSLKISLKKNYPNSNVKLQYQYRTKLEMSIVRTKDKTS